MKKILLNMNNIVNINQLKDHLISMDFLVVEWNSKFPNYAATPQVRGELEALLEDQAPDMVFTYNYSPMAAQCCYERAVVYICWCMDCPDFALYSRTISYDTNYIFLFDRVQYEYVRSWGEANVYYLPLAADSDHWSQVIEGSSESERAKYRSEVSFVGNLYTDAQHAAYDQVKYLPPYFRGYFSGLMEAQMQIYGYDFVKAGIPDSIWKELPQYVQWELSDDFRFAYQDFFVDMLHKKITAMERLQMVAVASEFFPFTLYCNTDTGEYPKADNRGYCDYEREMPLVFHESKINLNMTLRSITSGISLRVLDIMACGGFVLTNYQPEIAEYFEDGREIVMFTGMEDMAAKIMYYLEHEGLRREIAENGRKKVRELFSFERRLNELFSIVEKDRC